jgi:hypothetical protein
MLQIADWELMKVSNTGLLVTPIGQHYGHVESNMLQLAGGSVINLICHQAQPNAKMLSSVIQKQVMGQQ